MICYGQIRTANCIQEWYETSSRDAGTRTRSLRKAGFIVVTDAMGLQVTRVGLVRMSLVTILDGDFDNLPPVNLEVM